MKRTGPYVTLAVLLLCAWSEPSVAQSSPTAEEAPPAGELKMVVPTWTSSKPSQPESRTVTEVMSRKTSEPTLVLPAAVPASVRQPVAGSATRPAPTKSSAPTRRGLVGRWLRTEPTMVKEEEMPVVIEQPVQPMPEPKVEPVVVPVVAPSKPMQVVSTPVTVVPMQVVSTPVILPRKVESVPPTIPVVPVTSSPYGAVTVQPRPVISTVRPETVGGSPYHVGQVASTPTPLPVVESSGVILLEEEKPETVPTPAPLPLVAPPKPMPQVVALPKPMPQVVKQETPSPLPTLAPSTATVKMEELSHTLRYSTEVEERKSAVKQLMALPASQAIPLALVSAEDAVPAVREMAILVLGSLKQSTPEVRETVRQLCADPDSTVRERAKQLKHVLDSQPVKH